MKNTRQVDQAKYGIRVPRNAQKALLFNNENKNSIEQR